MKRVMKLSMSKKKAVKKTKKAASKKPEFEPRMWKWPSEICGSRE